jgi:tetratricopeptide (TPR) repeat protein
MTPLEQARKFLDDGNPDACWKICEEQLEKDPDGLEFLIMATYCAWKANRFVIGYAFGRRAVAQGANEPMAWLNLGINAHDLFYFEEAERCLQRAIQLCSDDNIHVKSMAWMNLSASYIDWGRFQDAEAAAREGLKIAPYSPKLKANLGFSMLGQGKWDGWEFYSYCLGLSHRQKQKFGEEPDWNGEKGKTVVLYGEQGLGDEICFASMVPDAIKDCRKVIISCEKSLEGLFRRSFPQAKVYGTRRAKPEDNIRWDKEDWQFDASCALGELGGLYRRADSDFPTTPHLVPDPERRMMWRALFDAKRKPVIGITWTGGVRHSGQKFRSMPLEGLYNVLKSVDAHWVSLQYKDAAREIAEFKARHPEIDISQYSHATLTADYDDTAAMVAELDLVISVQTAMVDLCGAIGKECWVLMPKTTQWRYFQDGETSLWYPSIRMFRQKTLEDWTVPMSVLTGRLRKRFGNRIVVAA